VPRPWQQPHPPVWSTTASKSNARVLGERGYVIAVLGSGYNTRMLYDSYREGMPRPTTAHCPARPLRLSRAVCDRAQRNRARRRGELVAGYLRTGGNVYRRSRTRPAICRSTTPRADARLHAGALVHQGQARVDMRTASVQDLIDSVLMICGTPDQCYTKLPTSSNTPAASAIC